MAGRDGAGASGLAVRRSDVRQGPMWAGRHGGRHGLRAPAPASLLRASVPAWRLIRILLLLRLLTDEPVRCPRPTPGTYAIGQSGPCKVGRQAGLTAAQG